MPARIRPPLVFNLGLPRTGNTSLCEAVRMLGLRPLHIWHRGEHDPGILEQLRRGEGPGMVELASYDLVTDTPFYALRSSIETHFPDSRLICTMRSREAWIESMLGHGRAGGAFLARHYQLPLPTYRRHHADDLGRAWERHRQEMEGVATLDLEASPADRWNLLCRALRVSESSPRRIVTSPWPHLNRLASLQPKKRARSG